MKVIGYELIFRHREGVKVLVARLQAAAIAAAKLALTGAPIPVAQRVIETAIIPKLTFGFLHRPAPQSWLRSNAIQT